MKRLFFFLAVAISLGWPGAASAQVPLKGYFIAFADCEANKKKDSDNPGNVRLEALRAYAMLGRNSTPGTHYQVRVPGAPETEARWVPMGCGAYAPQEFLVLAGQPPGNGGSGGNGDGLEPDSIEFVLAASWQPAFCATGAGQNKTECQTQTANRPDATQFSIHGLWPDDLDDKQIFPCYCDRGSPIGCGPSQARDTSIALSEEVLAELTVLMPGVQSDLHLHEWPKHGSCYEDDKTGEDNGASPDEYFREAMSVLKQLNASPVRALFANNLGEDLTRQQVEAAFDEAFGEGAGDRVVIRCSGPGNNRIITELWIGLKGDIGDPADLAGLIQAAPTTDVSSTQTSCAGGKVVEVTAS
jgi:ribonuclease T2